MPNPTASQVHVDGLLSNVALAYIQQSKNFACMTACPIVGVGKQSDKYPVWNKGDFNRIEADLRADGANAKRGGFRVDTSNTYFCDVYALEKVLTRRQKANAKGELDLERKAAQYLANQLLMKREKDFVDTFFASGWGTTWTGASASSATEKKYWSSSGSTPIVDVRDSALLILESTGYMPNTFIVSAEVHAKLLDHADVLDRIKYTQQAIASTQLMASLFGVEKYVVTAATNNTAKENATATMDFIAGKDALLCYMPSGASLDEPSAGYCFSWEGFDAVGADGQVAISRYEEPQSGGPGTEVLLGEMAFDHKVTGTDLGVFFDNIAA